MKQPTQDHSTPNEDRTDANNRRTRVGVLAAVAVGLGSLAALGTQLARAEAPMDASVDGTPYALAAALASIDVEPVEIIRIGAPADDDPQTDDGASPLDDLTATLGDVATTVGGTLGDLGACLLEQLPDVFGADGVFAGLGTDDLVGSVDPDTFDLDAIDLDAIDLDAIDLDSFDLDSFDLDAIDLEELSTQLDAVETACGDLLPDFGTLDLSDFDLSDFDLSELGLPTDFDLSDIDVDDFTGLDDLDVDAAGVDLDQLDIPTEIREVVTDIADQVVDFVRELPSDLRDTFDGLFGS